MKPLVKKCTSFAIAMLAVSASAYALAAQPAQAPAVASASASTLRTSTERRYYDETAVAPRGIIENIYYARKEQTYTLFENLVPYYSNAYTSLTNTCGPVAGAIVVGYYDKFFEELIPNYVAYYASGRYKTNDSTHVPALIQDLYTRMRTNVDDVGVSESDCINGLTSYVQSTGRTISYTNIGHGNSLNHTLCNGAIAQGRPILLFCDNFSLYAFGQNDGYDDWTQLQTTGAHIGVAFGYITVNYYDENDVLFRTDHHIEVATGWTSNRFGYLNANDGSWLNNGYIVDIT